MGMRFLLVILPSALLLTACDTFSHIRRDDDNLTSFPPGSCIEKVLKTTSGVEFRSHETSETKKWFGHDNDYVPIQYYNYSIIADSHKFPATILLDTDKDRKIKYSNGYSRVGRHLTEVEKQVIPPALSKVDTEIGKACGIKINSALHLDE